MVVDQVNFSFAKVHHILKELLDNNGEFDTNKLSSVLKALEFELLKSLIN